jgi:hypothetical protein
MPIAYEKDDARRRVTFLVNGEATEAEYVGVIARQAVEQAWSYAVLLDARERTGAAPSTRSITRIVDQDADQCSLYGTPGPMAIVAHDEVGFGMGRMYATLAGTGGRQIRVFRSLPDAETWLTAITS